MDPRMSSLPANRGHRATGVVNLCPYGCPAKALTEQGYCKHLVGFTLDGQTVELNEKFMAAVHDENGDPLDTGGRFQRTGPRFGKVEPTDVVVEVTNGRPVATPTRRVYRPGPDDKRVERSGQEQTQDLDALKAIVAEQQKQIEELKKLVA
jgi:hypothetical protein